MFIEVLKSKIYNIKVTEVDSECYEGSLALDRNLIEEANLRVFEKVLVVNLENGERFETYVIDGGKGGRKVALKGAAARKGLVGDRLIVMSFQYIEESEWEVYKPKIVDGSKVKI